MQGLGDFIGGEFVRPSGDALRSVDPATGAVVLETAADVKHVTLACDAAAAALPAWRALSFEARLAHLLRFRDAIKAHTEDIAEAIAKEMGKLRSEARVEVATLVARFDLVAARIREDMPDGPLPGHPMEALRHRPHGVVAVIGPFNFPLHLCHSHVVPALLLGNTVVMKPSELTPLAGQRYAEAAREAGLPPGVLNLVMGGGQTGAALLADKRVKALCFTGSWATGRRILEANLDRPEMLVALELGGKNTVVVLDDADVRQAAHEIVVGGYLTTGQRCTCTDRVLVHTSKRAALLAALKPLVASLKFGMQDDASVYGGPLASVRARENFDASIAKARAAGAVEHAKGVAPDQFAFAVPTLFELPDGMHHVDGYTNHEIFGPNLHLETFGSDDEAIALMNASMVGLANSVFTADEARFARFYAETHTGILNQNRSTNQASPRLPFGGTGTSGNFRPAGAYAARNLAVPVALQRKIPGVFTVDGKLLPHLVRPDLDALELKHGIEECKDAAKTLLATPRPLAAVLPTGGKLPTSAAWLARFYGEGRFPEEKKPGVFDHLRSAGPWMVSVDETPLSVLDGMSQTATVPSGFAEDSVVRHYVEGGFEDTLLTAHDTSMGDDRHAAAYADFLRSMVPGLPHVAFVNSGAEANEKAYALCLRYRKDDQRKKLLAFDGSFHGRTLLSLQASHSPAKRAPFEMKGFEVVYAPFSPWPTPQEAEPAEPSDLLSLVAKGKIDALVTKYATGPDRLLAEEVQSLAEVDRQLALGEFFAVVIEPIQSEGGDRYATSRFHRALRVLTRRHDVPLIYDEVQAGFGLGGTFTWHQRFGLTTVDGKFDGPDALIFAKRAQVGVVMSRFEDPEPSHAHTASLVRGLLHAKRVARDTDAARIESLVRPRLMEIAARYPTLVSHPRVTGYAAAFDLPSPDVLNRFLNQRFWRGVVVFAAGTKTARYRLSSSYDDRDLDVLFDAMDRSLAWIHGNPGINPPAWLDLPTAPRTDALPAELRIRRAEKSEAKALLESAIALEARVYEPARRDTPETLGLAFLDPDGIAVVAEAKTESGWKLVGSALAASLERVEHIPGPADDPMLGMKNTAYSLAITMDSDYRGMGLGRALKQAQLEAARDMKRADGTPRYRHVTGRNRVGHTAAMGRINKAFGAYEVVRLTGMYGVPDGQSSYYRIPLGPFMVDAVPREMPEDRPHSVDVASGLTQPFAQPPQSLPRSQAAGLLFGPAVNKLTLVNYITPAVVRAVEWVSALQPRFPHMYLTSSRDEAFDKVLRSIRVHRKNGQVAIGLDGGYVGHTSAAARSLSDPAVHAQGPAYFERFARVPHPSVAGVEKFAEGLKAAVATAGGADQVLGIFVELVQERTGRVLSDDAQAALMKVRAETGVPVVFVEHSTAQYRSGEGAFYSDRLAQVPDALIWWGGGQVGFVHVSSQYYVPAPLTLVSTWDGDELSLVRMHHQLRAARRVDVAAAIKHFDTALTPLRDAGLSVNGHGLYRVIDAGPRSATLLTGLTEQRIRARRYANGAIPLVPPLDLDAAGYTRLMDALGKAVR